jgi:hypothetical protein
MPDFLWPTDNELQIPVLRRDCQPSGVILPARAWGSLGRKREAKGGYHFYVDDYRFGHLWTHPEQLVGTRPLWVTEVNFSVFEHTPGAVAVWATYRKRWLSRYWQEAGIPIFVDLNVPENHQEVNLLGVPRGWNAFSTRGYEARVDDLQREIRTARRIAQTQDVILIVFGGGRKIAEVCRRERITHISAPLKEADHG